MSPQNHHSGSWTAEPNALVDNDPHGLELPTDSPSYNEKLYYIFKRHGPKLHLDDIRKLYSKRFPGDKNKCRDGAIRHNLSLNKNYVKMGDGLWTLSEETIARKHIEPTSRSRYRPDRDLRKHQRKRSFAKPSGQPRRIEPRSPIASSSQSASSSSKAASVDDWHAGVSATTSSPLDSGDADIPYIRQELWDSANMFQSYGSSIPGPDNHGLIESWHSFYGGYSEAEARQEQYWSAPVSAAAEFDSIFGLGSSMYDPGPSHSWELRFVGDDRKPFE